MRDLYEIAKEAACDTVAAAQCAGYDTKIQRRLFFVSDRLDLAGEIHRWLEAHMEPMEP